MPDRKVNSDMDGILFVTPFFRPSTGGAETYIDGLCDYLRAGRYRVYVQTYQPLYADSQAGSRMELLPNMAIRRYGWVKHDLFHKLEGRPVFQFLYITPYLLVRSFIWMLHHHRKVQIIDAQGLNAAFINRLLGFLFKKKRTVTILALYNFRIGSLFAKIVKWVFKGSDLILIEKGRSRQELASIQVPQKRMVTFNQWADFHRFRPTEKDRAKAKLNWSNRFIVLFVGRAIPEKGATLLLEAARRVGSGICFAFVTNNTGPVADAIAAAAESMPSILFIGEVDYADLHRYYQAADLFCIPSLYEEGFARVVSESISCGTPVIASNRGSLPDLLDEQVSVIVEPTVENFAKEIASLYRDPPKLARMAKNCIPYAREQFGVKNLEIIGGAYKKLLPGESRNRVPSQSA